MNRNQSSGGGARAQVIKASDQVAIKHQAIDRTFRGLAAWELTQNNRKKLEEMNQ